MSVSRLVLAGECPAGVQVRYLLSGSRVTVGRHGDIPLNESSVSREHAVLMWNGDAWKVADSGSRNGTFVNGVSIQRKFIVPGDEVRFGRVKLRLVDPDSEIPEGDECETCGATMIVPRPDESVTFTPSGPGAKALVGRSDVLREAMRMATKAARSSATVLLVGESGTGKELFARLVWEESSRSAGKFLPVHSGAIEPTLLASALFGYEKGAFTGAECRKKGLFEEADGGTIFLDEIGEINADTQVKLLRVLQEGEFLRVGGTEPVKVDVRVICATNRDLAAAVAEGRFREDLYYRLNVIGIKLPPLRERRDDIDDLVMHYVEQLGGPHRRVSPEAMALLRAYRWPGNVRELRNVVERMTVMAEGEVLGVGDLPPEIAASASAEVQATGAGTESLAETESRCIREMLVKCGGNKKLAAEKLGISRSTLYERLKAEGETAETGVKL